MDINGAFVVVVTDSEPFLLLKRPGWIHWAPGKWAFPGGKLEEERRGGLESGVLQGLKADLLELRDTLGHD